MAHPAGTHPPLAAALGGLAGIAAAVWFAVHSGDPVQGRGALLGWIALAWAAFTLGVWGVRRMPVRAAVPLLVAGGVLVQLVAMTSPPRLTDDFYRYAWDGRVQAAGISPYRYVPTDEALADLRTPWLFPPGCSTTTAAVTHVCTRMNHPTSPTIYPPVAQAEFTVVHLLTRPLGADGGRDRTWQVVGALLAVATTLALVRVLRRRGDPRQAVLWAWCPTVALEAGGNAHVDVLSSLIVVLALGAAADGRRTRAGMIVGLAVATKLLPLLLLPALAGPWRGAGRERLRGPAVTVAATAGVVAAVYLPHLIAAGPKVLGFLPGYLPEEGFDGRSRFALLPLPGAGALVAGLLILAAVAIWAFARVEEHRPWRAAMVTVGLTLAVVGISYPWYALLLVPLVALDGRATWLAVAAAAYPAYLAPALGWSPTAATAGAYGAALVVVTIAARAAGTRLAGP